ncbi:MAG: hypothetical protein K8I27_10445 [Planctomycetes bacterium]|nr:hypothetical protein [Planctomycetota bacterium]
MKLSQHMLPFVMVGLLVLAAGCESTRPAPEPEPRYEFPPGTIMMSTLSPATFEKEFGDGWVLLSERFPGAEGHFPKIAGPDDALGSLHGSNVGKHTHTAKFVEQHNGIGEPVEHGILVPNLGYGKFKDLQTEGYYEVIKGGPEGETYPKHIPLNFYFKE